MKVLNLIFEEKIRTLCNYQVHELYVDMEIIKSTKYTRIRQGDNIKLMLEMKSLGESQDIQLKEELLFYRVSSVLFVSYLAWLRIEIREGSITIQYS